MINVGAGLGVYFGDKFRTDVTWIRHINPKLKTGNSNGVVNRKPEIDAFFLNTYYELGNLVSVFNPYMGVGIGVSAIKEKIYTAAIGNQNISHSLETV